MIIYSVSLLVFLAVVFAIIFCRLDNLKENINKLECRNDELKRELTCTLHIINKYLDSKQK